VTAETVVLRGAPWPAIAGLTACAAGVGACGVALVNIFVGRPLLATAFALLAAASAFALDEPANAVVDVAPASPPTQTVARAPALVVPLGAGLVLVLATALRGADVPATGMTLALVGNVLLGFAVAVAGLARVRLGEPGVGASTATAFLLIAPTFGPPGWRINTLPSDSLWWTVSAISLLLVAVAARIRRYRR
jgi:hypothetical protein